MRWSDAGTQAAPHPALEHFRRQQCRTHPEVRGIFLTHDGGPSHTARATREYLAASDGWWRPRLTPAHASWMNPSELLNHAFCQPPLPAAGLVGQRGRVHHARARLGPRVQPALRAPVRVDLDQSPDAALVCRAYLAVNFAHYSRAAAVAVRQRWAANATAHAARWQRGWPMPRRSTSRLHCYVLERCGMRIGSQVPARSPPSSTLHHDAL